MKVALAAAALLAVGLAYWLLRGDSKDAPQVALVPAPAQPPAPAPHPTIAVPAAVAAATIDGGAPLDPTSYEVGGVAIRDHRGDGAKPMDLTPNLHDPGARKLPSTLVAAITNQVRQALYACAGGIPPEARGTRPKLDGRLTVSIKDRVLSVDHMEAVLRDVAGASLDPTQQCIETRARALTAPAGEEADLQGYIISVSYLIP